MDARTVLAQWLAEDNPERRGRQRLLHGTTPEGYRDDVTAWLDFLDKIGLSAWEADGSTVKTWLDSTRHSPRSRARHVSALGTFYTHAQRLGYVGHSPAHPALRGRPDQEPGLALLSHEQMQAVREAADGLKTPTATRDRLLIYLMLAGLRPRQIIELDLRDLHHEQHRLTADVWQKGGGTRLTALPAEIAWAIEEYLPVRVHDGPHSYADRGPVLTTYRGQRLDSNQTPRTVLRGAVIASAVCTAAGVPRDVKPDAVAHSPSPLSPVS